MELTGLKFEVAPGFFNEDSMPLNLPPKKYVREMAVRKAQGVAVKYSDALVIGADTIVICKSASWRSILGKPKNKKEAGEILKFCRNKICDVLTGVAVIDAKNGDMKTFVDSTKVKMRDYSDDAIEEYVSTGRPLEFAGAFAIQDRDWVKSINGSFFNVVGFPILRVLEILERFGAIVPENRLKEIKLQDIYKY